MTSDAKHTPGPWRTDFNKMFGQFYIFNDSGIGCIGAAFTGLEPDDTGEANARLIAAAPDFYEVCKAYEQWEADLVMDSDAWRNSLPTLSQASYDRLIEIQAMRNAAIAKAKGETP